MFKVDEDGIGEASRYEECPEGKSRVVIASLTFAVVAESHCHRLCCRRRRRCRRHRQRNRQRRQLPIIERFQLFASFS